MPTQTETTTSAEVSRLNREYTLFSWSIQNEVAAIPIDHAEGVYLWDLDGKRYLDFSSQAVNVNIGHGRPEVVRAIQEQAARLCYVNPGYATEPRGRLGEAIAAITPGDLKKSFFCLGGADANENALKMARLFTGRQKLLARYRSYHGATLGAAALTGDYRRLPVEPAIPGVVHFLDPYCYRCPFGWTRETCHRECIRHVEQVIQFEGPDRIAAIIMEGVTGANGVLVPPEEYWPSVREMCDRYDILLIADEVMSGWGRTGKWFAVDHWGVVPDLITTAKGITSGYVPLGAVIVSRKISDFFETHYLPCGLTCNAHPLACAAALATIAVYQKDHLIENSASLGLALAARLEEVRHAHPSVGDVRALGLFAAIELVRDGQSKQPMPAAVMTALSKTLKANGLLPFILNTPQATALFVTPPLCITQAQLEDGLRLCEQALAVCADPLAQ